MPTGPRPPQRRKGSLQDPQSSVVGRHIADAAVGALEDPKLSNLRAAMKEAGLPPKTIESFVRRLRTNLSPVLNEAKRYTLAQVNEELEKRIAMVLGYIDDYSASQAGFKDLTIGLAVLIDKHQLLTNKPTQIIDFTSRQQVSVLMPMVIAEAKRRGIEIPGEAVRVPDGAG